jgi:hypothetical protein
MTGGAESPLRSSLLFRALPLLVGLVTVATGVALNESGVSAGRTIILVGLPLALAGLVWIALPRRNAEGPEPVTSIDGGPAESVAIVVAHWELSSKLGAGPQGAGLSASGIVKGRHVELLTESGDWPLLVRAATNRTLDMGLTVQRGGKPPGDARREYSTGDAPFDAEYCVRVDEVARAGNLLTSRMREQLLQAHASLDDDGVSIMCGPCDGDTLLETVRLAVRVAAELDRAAVKVSCAETLGDVRDTWLTFANKTKLATAGTPLSMWGTIDGIDVKVQSVRDSFRNFHFEVTTSFPEPLGRGLSLKPASSATQFDRTGEPIGHPAFDRNFSLTTTQPIDAARLLGPETRLAVLRLREQGLQLRGSDERLWAWVGFNPSQPDAVPAGVERMVQIAARIVANAERFAPKPPRNPEDRAAPVDGSGKVSSG